MAKSRDAPDDIPADPIGSVEKVVLKRAVAHPTTVFPLVGAGLSAMWLATVSFTPLSLGAGLGFVFLGGASFVWHYFVRGEKYADEYADEFLRREKQEVIAASQSIADECAESGFEEGAKEAAELAQAYAVLQQRMDEVTEGKPHAACDRIRRSVDETYESGVAKLRKALQFYRTIQAEDLSKVRRERTLWLKKLPTTAGRERENLEKRIADHESRIRIVDDHQAEIDQRITAVNAIQAAFTTANFDVANLDPDSADDAADRLERDLSALRNGRDELRQQLGKRKPEVTKPRHFDGESVEE